MRLADVTVMIKSEDGTPITVNTDVNCVAVILTFVVIETERRYKSYPIKIITMSVKEIQKKVALIPEEQLKEVDRYLNAMLKSAKEKESKKRKAKFDFSWEGALAEDGKKYTSVEMQHLIWEGEMKKYEKYK